MAKKYTKAELREQEVHKEVLGIVQEIAGEDANIGSTKALNKYVGEREARIIKIFGK